MKKQPNLKQNNPEVTTEQRFTCSQLTIGKVEKKKKQNMFKRNNKDTRMTSFKSFWCHNC